MLKNEIAIVIDGDTRDLVKEINFFVSKSYGLLSRIFLVLPMSAEVDLSDLSDAVTVEFIGFSLFGQLNFVLKKGITRIFILTDPKKIVNLAGNAFGEISPKAFKNILLEKLLLSSLNVSFVITWISDFYMNIQTPERSLFI